MKSPVICWPIFLCSNKICILVISNKHPNPSAVTNAQNITNERALTQKKAVGRNIFQKEYAYHKYIKNEDTRSIVARNAKKRCFKNISLFLDRNLLGVNAFFLDRNLPKVNAFLLDNFCKKNLRMLDNIIPIERNNGTKENRKGNRTVNDIVDSLRAILFRCTCPLITFPSTRVFCTCSFHLNGSFPRNIIGKCSCFHNRRRFNTCAR